MIGTYKVKKNKIVHKCILSS